MLEDMRELLGGEVGHRGDASSSLDWLCIVDVHANWVLWLQSGPTHADRIGSFQLRRLPPDSQVDPRCTSLLEDASEVEIPIQIWLGTPVLKVIEVLGEPTATLDNGVLLYFHAHEPGGTRLEFTDEVTFNTIWILLQDEVVEAIEVWGV